MGSNKKIKKFSEKNILLITLIFMILFGIIFFGIICYSKI